MWSLGNYKFRTRCRKYKAWFIYRSWCFAQTAHRKSFVIQDWDRHNNSVWCFSLLTDFDKQLMKMEGASVFLVTEERYLVWNQLVLSHWAGFISRLLLLHNTKNCDHCPRLEEPFEQNDRNRKVFSIFIVSWIWLALLGISLSWYL